MRSSHSCSSASSGSRAAARGPPAAPGSGEAPAKEALGGLDGDVELDQQGVGAFIKAGLSQLFGDAVINVEVAGTADDHAFTASHRSVHRA